MLSNALKILSFVTTHWKPVLAGLVVLVILFYISILRADIEVKDGDIQSLKMDLILMTAQKDACEGQIASQNARIDALVREGELRKKSLQKAQETAKKVQLDALSKERDLQEVFKQKMTCDEAWISLGQSLEKVQWRKP